MQAESLAPSLHRMRAQQGDRRAECQWWFRGVNLTTNTAARSRQVALPVRRSLLDHYSRSSGDALQRAREAPTDASPYTPSWRPSSKTRKALTEQTERREEGSQGGNPGHHSIKLSPTPPTREGTSHQHQPLATRPGPQQPA